MRTAAMPYRNGSFATSPASHAGKADRTTGMAPPGAQPRYRREPESRTNIAAGSGTGAVWNEPDV